MLMYAAASPETRTDLLYGERGSDGELGEPAVFLATPSDELSPQFSPDGRFVLYVSDESGRNEVYVRSFPGGERKWQISTNRGGAPSWRGDGQEIYYLEGIKLMAVPVSNRNGFSPGQPVRLFENPDMVMMRRGYDAAADGQRFVVRERLPQKEPLAIHIVHNWIEEFRDKSAR
jgi:dipeptidyl aminopeptidase/acylaminoacyl peptidase